MLTSLEPSHAKSRDYYKETDKMRGHIYAACTMISLDSRFQFFFSDDWADAKELRVQYRIAFRNALTPTRERLASAQHPQGSSLGSIPRSILHNLVRSQKSHSKATPSLAVTELMQYLDGSKLNPSSLHICLHVCLRVFT